MVLPVIDDDAYPFLVFSILIVTLGYRSRGFLVALCCLMVRSSSQIASLSADKNSKVVLVTLRIEVCCYS